MSSISIRNATINTIVPAIKTTKCVATISNLGLEFNTLLNSMYKLYPTVPDSVSHSSIKIIPTMLVITLLFIVNTPHVFVILSYSLYTYLEVVYAISQARNT